MRRRSALGVQTPEEEAQTELGIRRQDIMIVFVVVAFGLALGSLGYYYTTQLGLLDSFYNASLILSGMGPANPITTVGGRYFASFFAVFSGFVFTIVITIFIQRIILAEVTMRPSNSN